MPPPKSPGARHFVEDEITFSGKFSGNVFATVRDSFRPWWARLALLLVVGLAARLLLLATANILGMWADSLCHGDHCRTTAGSALVAGFTHSDFLRVLIWFALTGFVLNTLFRVAISRTGALAVSSLYDEVTMRTSRLPMSFFDTTPVGRIVSRFGSDYGAVFRMAGGPLGEFLCLVFDLILMLMLTMVASVWFAPVVVAMVLLNLWLYRLNNPRLREERRALSAARGPAIAHFSETAQGTVPIKVFGKRETFLERFNKLLARTMIHRIRTMIAVHGFALQMTSVTAMLLLVTGVGGIWLINSGRTSVGSVGVAFTFIMMTSTTIQQFFEWLANLEEAMTGVERLDNYLRRPLERGALVPARSRMDCGQPRAKISESSLLPANLTQLAGVRQVPEVKVDDLWLRYRPDLPWVLKGVTFHVEPREHFAIVGRTGCGKSSLIQALYLLYPAERGSIAVDKMTAGAAPLDQFRRTFSLIPQEPVLFRATLRENLCVDTRTTEADIRAALREIGIEPWVDRLAGKSAGGGIVRGLDYVVEERGANLSTGERQLLCMARAMIQGAPVLIMDEATSAIDPHSEELLVRATRHVLADRTRIVVAHRLSTIADCQRVLWLDGGQVRALDTPDRILPLKF